MGFRFRFLLLAFALIILSALPLFSLQIYRPENKGVLNDIPCLIRITDMDGKDASASITHISYNWYYELRTLNWRGEPKMLNRYFDGCFTGGVILHLLTKPGKYLISVYTPLEKQQGYSDSHSQLLGQRRTWESNTFTYDTKNPPKVIFVSPTANDNGFFNGGWHVDYRAPKFFQYTKPYRSQ